MLALGVDNLGRRAPGDEVENIEVLAGLRRREAEASDDRGEGMLDPALPGRPGRRAGAQILFGEERRVDHHRALELLAEMAREAHRHAAAERVADDDGRSGL